VTGAPTGTTIRPRRYRRSRDDGSPPRRDAPEGCSELSGRRAPGDGTSEHGLRPQLRGAASRPCRASRRWPQRPAHRRAGRANIFGHRFAEPANLTGGGPEPILRACDRVQTAAAKRPTSAFVGRNVRKTHAKSGNEPADREPATLPDLGHHERQVQEHVDRVVADQQRAIAGPVLDAVELRLDDPTRGARAETPIARSRARRRAAGSRPDSRPWRCRRPPGAVRSTCPQGAAAGGRPRPRLRAPARTGAGCPRRDGRRRPAARALRAPHA
jgi:hypothetical protein